MRPVLLVPGIQGSGPTHWQSLWEAQHPGVQRVVQRDWDHPRMQRVGAGAGPGGPCVHGASRVVAHSLGCLVVAHWVARSTAPAHAALLVAVPDPEGEAFPRAASGFAPVPRRLPGLQAMVVSSSDDPYASPAYAERLMADWGSEWLALRAQGHLNAQSKLRDWPQGWALVERLRA